MRHTHSSGTFRELKRPEHQLNGIRMHCIVCRALCLAVRKSQCVNSEHLLPAVQKHSGGWRRETRTQALTHTHTHVKCVRSAFSVVCVYLYALLYCQLERGMCVLYTYAYTKRARTTTSPCGDQCASLEPPRITTYVCVFVRCVVNALFSQTRNLNHRSRAHSQADAIIAQHTKTSRIKCESVFDNN